MDKLVADGEQPFDTKIYGEYITKSSTEFKSMLDTIIDANPESQLVIVVKDAESISKYNSYSSRSKKIKVITADKIQGDEGDFFFFDNTYAPQDKSHPRLLFHPRNQRARAYKLSHQAKPALLRQKTAIA